MIDQDKDKELFLNASAIFRSKIEQAVAVMNCKDTFECRHYRSKNGVGYGVDFMEERIDLIIYHLNLSRQYLKEAEQLRRALL